MPLSLGPESSSEFPRDASPSLVPEAGLERAAELDSERDRLIAALDSCAGNQTRAAEQLQITRRALKIRMDRYGIEAS